MAGNRLKWPWAGALERAREEGARAAYAGVAAELKRAQQQTHGGTYGLDYPWRFVNLQSPRRHPGALVDVGTLRQLAGTCDLVRSCILHLQREVASVPIEVVPKDEDDDSPATQQAILDAWQWFSRDGGLGGFQRRRTRFERQIIEDLLVIGAVAIYSELTIGRMPAQSHAIDAATIRPVLDTSGWPVMDQPYEQWIQGRKVRSFAADELTYDGLWPATDSPYYRSPVEFALAPIIAELKADEWNREWLVSGDAPGDDVFSLPEGLNPVQIQAWIETYQATRSGDTAGRRRTCFLPSGSQRLSTGTRKDQDFQQFELWLLRRICAIFGVQPASIGYAGEQYKVSQETGNSQTSEFGAGELLQFRADLYNDQLIALGLATEDGSIEVRNVDTGGEDAQARANRLQTLVSAGILTPNEARSIEGFEPLEGADELRGLGQGELEEGGHEELAEENK